MVLVIIQCEARKMINRKLQSNDSFQIWCGRHIQPLLIPLLYYNSISWDFVCCAQFLSAIIRNGK